MGFPATGTPVEGDTPVLRASGAWAPPTLPTTTACSCTSSSSSYSSGRWCHSGWRTELNAKPLSLRRRHLFLRRKELPRDKVLTGTLTREGGLRRVVRRIRRVVQVPHGSQCRLGFWVSVVFAIQQANKRERKVKRLQLFSGYAKERERWRVLCEEEEKKEKGLVGIMRTEQKVTELCINWGKQP